MSGVQVRRGEAADLEQLLAIEDASFHSDRLRRRQYQRHLHSASAQVLVATGMGGAVLGSAVLFLRRGSDLARLYSLATLPAARGRGVGGRLLQAVEDAAQVAGARRLRLEVRCDNAAAMHLYQRQGYRRIGRCPAYYADGCDAWQYERPLA